MERGYKRLKLSKFNDLLEGNKTTEGRWELTPNHELRYKSKGQDEEYKLTGTLVAVEPGALVFSVTERQTDQKIVTSLHQLTGQWKLNPKNQITFEAEKEQGKNDVLTFKGAWQVNDDHEIVYTYEKTKLKTKANAVRGLVFKGYWDISDDNRLSYFVGGDSNNAFRLRGAFETKSILAKKGEIRYQIGLEAAGRRKIQTITLFGKWKLSRDLALGFEIEYAGGKKRAISFGGDYALNDTTQISVNLKSQAGEPLGMELILTKDLFGKEGQAFVRLQKSLEESGAEAGMRLKW